MFTLEKLCLDLIVQNFELFYFAFTVSQDDNLQRNFDFLQRRFSAQLAETLHEAGKLEEEYLELLINEHLNYLNDTWLGAIGPKISWNDVFLRLPNLKKVVLWCSKDESLESLAKFCPKLVEICIIGGRNVTDNGVKYPCMDTNEVIPCPERKNIFISTAGAGVTDKGAEYLIRNLPSLQRIHYPNVPFLIQCIHEKDLHEFKTVKYYNLVELSFKKNYYIRPQSLSKSKQLPNRTEILKTCLTVCPKLKYLSCYISDKEQLTFLANTHLKKLNLEFPIIDPKIDISFFLKLKVYYITSLRLTDCSMSIFALELHFPILKDFNAVRVIFSIDDDDDMKLNFSSLSECKFKDIQLSSQKAIGLILSSSPKLECVAFNRCKLSLALKSQILLWGKSVCPKIIELHDMDIVSEMEFLEDVLINCPSVKKMLLSPSYEVRLLDRSKLAMFPEKFRNLVKNLHDEQEIHLC